MRGLTILFCALLGLALSGLFVIAQNPLPAIATEPAVTAEAADHISDTLCHLEVGQDCTLVNLLDLAATSARPRTYPANGAHAVPGHAHISIAFDRDMDPATVHNGSFYLSQGNQRVAGTVRYLTPGQMAIFQPDAPLEPGTTYTATLTAAIQDTAGQPLAGARVWHFTTSAAHSDSELAALTGNLKPYFGDLHSHTGYSDGAGIPADAFAGARASGLDFYGVSEHAFMLTGDEWQSLLAQAEAATINGQFVALPGVEYSGPNGHLNIFGSDTFIHYQDPNYDTLPEVYAWLANHPTAIAQFNHPRKEPGLDWNFFDFTYDGPADLKIVLQELQTTDQFFLAMNKGWHLGTLKNRDTHQADWGCCPLMGLMAANLTIDAVLDALRARRTFFVSPNDSNFALTMQANGTWMGSAVPQTNFLNVTITAYDPDPVLKPLRLRLYDNGVVVASTTLPPSTIYSWSPQVPAVLGHYYYAEAFYDGWWYPAYSSPIWVERSPAAEAGPQQVVAPGSTVTLDGSGSWDPDGDALAYRWGQEAGTNVSLNQSSSAQPSFVAPTAPFAEVVLRLTVTDPGGLTGTDTVSILVTDNPVLAITKHGPALAEPGEPIMYTLTVTNVGLTPASTVVITDAVPAGATYRSGGSLLPGNIVSWTLPNLPANGGTAQVTFTVTTEKSVTNDTYRASCANCVAGVGQVKVVTNGGQLYLPIVRKR